VTKGNGADRSGKRPFWMHQLVEYILGGAMVAVGMQSPKPIVPSVLGGVILLYAASTRGALSAFRLLNRSLHRWLDPVFILLTVVAAVQPWVSVRNDTRTVMAAIAVVWVVVWLGSSFAEKPKREKAAGLGAGGDISTEIGKKAGRAVGTGVNMVRAAKAKRDARDT
jgi:uncharacterized membrane protein YhaH (DUF805 family)